MILEFLQRDGATEAGYLKDLMYDHEGLFAWAGCHSDGKWLVKKKRNKFEKECQPKAH